MKDVILAAVPPGVLLSIPHPIRFSDEYVSLFSPDWQLGGGTGGTGGTGDGGRDGRLRLLSGLAWRIAEAAVCVRRLRSRWQKWARTTAATGAMLARTEVSCGEDQGGTRLLSPPTAAAEAETDAKEGEREREGRGRDAKAAALRRAIAWRREEIAAAIEVEEEAGDFFIDVQLPAVAAAVQTTASTYDARVDEIGRVRGPLLTLAVERHVQTLQTIAGEAPGARGDPPVSAAAPEETEEAPASPAAAAAAAAEAWIRSASLAAEVALGTIGEAMDAIVTSPLPGITAGPFSSSRATMNRTQMSLQRQRHRPSASHISEEFLSPPTRQTGVSVSSADEDSQIAGRLIPAGRMMTSVISQPGDTNRPSKMEISEGTSNPSGTGVIMGYPQQTELKSARLDFKKERNGVDSPTPGAFMAAPTTTGSGKSGVPAGWNIRQMDPSPFLTMGNPRPGSQRNPTTADHMSLYKFARENWEEITKTIQARKTPSPSRP